MKEYKIVINNEILNLYKEYYFNKYPKKRVMPILKPIPPSFNYFISIKRIAQNSVKQKYKEFSIWLASYYDVANLKLNKAEFTYTFFFPDHRRRDFDNLLLTPKFINDGLVEAGVLVDDNGENLMLKFNSFQYDKNNPRVEFIIKDVS
jgi:Holliday junction resolvase RusA-like endonuclease